MLVYSLFTYKSIVLFRLVIIVSCCVHCLIFQCYVVFSGAPMLVLLCIVIVMRSTLQITTAIFCCPLLTFTEPSVSLSVELLLRCKSEFCGVCHIEHDTTNTSVILLAMTCYFAF